MSDDPLYSAPIILNPWKHHRNYIIEQINDFTLQPDGMEQLLHGLSTIGNSVTDMYLGNLLIEHIRLEILFFLKTNECFEPKAYAEWIAQNNGYQLVGLSDGSNWTLRLGKETDYHVHVHPSRYSLLTIRMKAMTLKTIIATLFWCMMHNESITLKTINLARRVLLNESPLKQISERNGIGKGFKIFRGG